MDINGTAYFLLREPHEFEHTSTRFRWDRGRRALVLAQRQRLQLDGIARAPAIARWESATPLVRDEHGQLGRISDDGSVIEVNPGTAGGNRLLGGPAGFSPLLDDANLPVRAPAGSFTDLTLGRVGAAGPQQTPRIAAPYSHGASHGLLLFDLRRRWRAEIPLDAPARRAAIAADGVVWAITADALLRISGEPLPLPYRPQATRFEPLTPNPNPPRLDWRQPLPAGLAALAIALDGSKLFLLAHDDDAQLILRREQSDQPGADWQRFRLTGAPFCIDLGVLPEQRVAALPALPAPSPEPVGNSALRHPDCPVFELPPRPEQADDAEPDTTSDALLLGERYPLRRPASDRFVSSADGRLRYTAGPEPGASAPDLPPTPVLIPLPRPVFEGEASVTLRLGPGDDGLDSGAPGNLWHRLYLEACIPPGCGIAIGARAFDDPELRADLPFIEQPAPQWNPIGTERPGGRPLLTPVPDEAGLFELLLQRRDGANRRLRGRFLELRLTFTSDGRRTPAIHAIRIYAPRFSYQEAYLPEFLRQQPEPAAETPGTPASGADVRERMLAAFEGILTPIEGRIKAAEALLHPDSMPAGQIGWLARTLGLEAPEEWPEQRRRRLLCDGTEVQRRRGTLAGVRLALDIATDGGVGRGEVVVVENFRLRRTMATVLGLDMDDSDHPLTLGTGSNANSIVGDALFLSEAEVPEVLALFAPEVAETEDERTAVQTFFEQYAHRVSVLLHGPARVLVNQVEDCLAAEMPARVQWRIVPTDHPFVLGLAPLLAVDSYIEPRPAPRPVLLDDTHLGREGLLVNAAALSPIHLTNPSGTGGAGS